MCPRNDERLRRCDKSLIDIFYRKRHIGTVLSIKNQRKSIAIFDAQEYQCGEAILVGGYMGCINAVSFQLFDQKSAHMLVAHSGEHRRLQSLAGHTNGLIAGRTAQVFPEVLRVFQPRAQLFRIEIYAGTTETDCIKCLVDHPRFPTLAPRSLRRHSSPRHVLW